MKSTPFYILGGLFIGLAIGLLINIDNQPKIDLPEEYKEIDDTSLLTGSFSKDSTTLYLRFYNTPDDVVEFQWDGDERDIPFEKGSRIEVAGSDGNIVYLVPIDE